MHLAGNFLHIDDFHGKFVAAQHVLGLVDLGCVSRPYFAGQVNQVIADFPGLVPPQPFLLVLYAHCASLK